MSTLVCRVSILHFVAAVFRKIIPQEQKSYPVTIRVLKQSSQTTVIIIILVVVLRTLGLPPTRAFLLGNSSIEVVLADSGLTTNLILLSHDGVQWPSK